MAQSTRDRLIDTAKGVFYREGFQMVGLDRILNEVGVTKTTFYNHFESKDDLILEVLRVQDRWWREAFAKMLRERGGEDPRAQLGVVFDALDDILNSDDYHGCFFINVAVEFPAPHHPAHQAAAENKRAIEAILCDLAARAGARDAPVFAQQLSLLMEGAFVTQQVTNNAQTVRIARQMADLLLEKHLPPAA